MAIDFYTTVLVLGVITAVIGGAIGLKLASRRGKSMTIDIFNERLDLLQQQNKELKNGLRIARGTTAQMKEGITLPEGADIDQADEGAMDGMIKGLIGKYSNMAPPQLRPFLQDPAIVGFLLQEAKKNPEQTKEILKQFIGKNGSVSKSSDGSATQQQELEALSSEGA